ncbi:oxysterol-binding -related 8 isoform X4 [Brachionus plicatilis]|uniref:Oxysterol-binding-related 8 isoform X4 n=1 Tax=Brachionus plicatilis TaxID=10195 RepID=A0A3M7QWK3_BRAPC|nr:oxysterol-binding -related 8 isoform X4 [Brachionus plicatilis]
MDSGTPRNDNKLCVPDGKNRSRSSSSTFTSSKTMSIKSSSTSSSTNSIHSIKNNSKPDEKEAKLSCSSTSSSSSTSSASSSSCSFVSASLSPESTQSKPDASSNQSSSQYSPNTINKSATISNLPKETNYKQQKENYLTEKKRITNDIITVMRDESIIILADWLKVRSSLKNWIKLYVILKPGIMLLFKSDKMKSGHWVGTVILNSCQLLERPSKKHGFCFKLFHPLERSIWASKGPSGEININVPYILLPTFYLIFRTASEKIGNIWMESIELALKTSNLTKPTVLTNPGTISNLNESFKSATTEWEKTRKKELTSASFNQSDIENNHFKEIYDKDESQLSDSEKNSSDEACSLNSSLNNDDTEFYNDENTNCTTINSNDPSVQYQVIDSLVNRDHELDDAYSINETNYVPSPKEEFGELGNKGQTEEVAEENRSLILHLVKQVRPGMDLSKVTLPTFILEPRSFLEKLTDYYYHSDILSESINNDDPFERMKSVVRFYLSGFYKKPKGLKKPYNPILGEIFRSYWYNPKKDSKTFYIAEQVSHHPPITSFYVSNRKEGFCIYGTILARSKFYGNSVSAIMDGSAKLILLNRGEEYNISLPYANCKGILIGKLTMELGGKVSINCPKTGYSTDIEFKLKPLLGGIEASNLIEGKIKFAKETVAVVHGKWDGEIILQEKRENKETILWKPDAKIIESRLKRFIVSLDDQEEFESEKLWAKVSQAIKNSDQNLATEEKSKIESKQREEGLERRAKFVEYKSRLFTFDSINKEWVYNFADLRPWDPQNDLYQYEEKFKILTKSKHTFRVNDQPRTSLLTACNQAAHCLGRLAQGDQSVVTNGAHVQIMQENFNYLRNRIDKIDENLKCLRHIFEINGRDFDGQKFRSQTNNLLMVLVMVSWFVGILTALMFK